MGNGALIRECFEKLGPYIVSCHAKDIVLHHQAALHFDEIIPGEGQLDERLGRRRELKEARAELAQLDEQIASTR